MRPYSGHVVLFRNLAVLKTAGGPKKFQRVMPSLSHADREAAGSGSAQDGIHKSADRGLVVLVLQSP